MSRRLISLAGSPKLPTSGLAWFFGLVLAATFYQLGHSIQEITLTFFHSWVVFAGPIPLPAGRLLYAALGVNLVVSVHHSHRAHRVRHWGVDAPVLPQ